MRAILMLCVVGAFGVATARAEPIEMTVNVIGDTGVGESLGSVTFENSRFEGVMIGPDLSGLPPGIHGFHVHAKPDCGTGLKDGEETAGVAAGGHYDPQRTDSHEGPYGRGHLGDLPVLHVDEDGTATIPVLAPRLELADLRGRAVIVHQDGDNYSDDPEPLGGGGSRIACGVIPRKDS
ncbi:superoxide dismutase family protein [Thiohalomonas denitrificans]|uniref:Superoxide dismutase [Cu-Zn] n=1 Tax=Thiohalomonas denitrificans TaxID=415747 RepID=A0A1G5PUZ9_9GAMM|nr:superoxide dismutase family protein [Thiohalomonas denitrificans]SCZ53394.1 superoxide dismutase, Cu-Zn family [Thiohalomonas denitrificans]